VSAALGRVGLGLLLLAAGAAAARAHVGGSTGYAAITVSRSTVRYKLSLPTTALPSDLAEALRLFQTGSEQNRDKLLDVLRRHIVLRSNGTRCEPGPGQVAPSAFDATTFTMHLDFACGSAVRDLVVQDNIFDVLGPDHHTLARVEANGETRELAFAPESREARISVEGRDAGGAEGTLSISCGARPGSRPSSRARRWRSCSSAWSCSWNARFSSRMLKHPAGFSASC
jgi:hypothetical protein